jgi:ubiquinone/menaquinone biosynthesis C-methylase UbiE
LKNTLPKEIKNLDVLVDIGAGNAELSDYFGQQLQAKQVYALDVYPEKEFIQPSPTSTVIYKQINNLNIPLPSSSVDLVMMMMFLHHIEDKQKIIQEVYRVLNPGGFVFFREHDVDPKDYEMVRYLDQVHAKFVPDYKEHSVEKTYYISKDNLSKMLTQNNLKKVMDSNYKSKNPQAIYHSLYSK